MIKLILTKCKICSKERTARGFGQHIQKSHNMSLKEYIIKYEYNNIPPTCACGCGNLVTIRGYQIMEYLDGHCPAGHYKLGETPERDYNKWMTNLIKGIRNYNNTAKLNDPMYRSGENNNFYGKKHSPTTKILLRNAVELQIQEGRHPFIGNNNGRIGTSSLERKFADYLDIQKVDYIPSYQISYQISKEVFPRNKYYDFFIPHLNLLVEIHGSYWHPQNTENLTEMQKGNLKNDEFKRELAKDRGFDLLVIYDYELGEFINNNLLTVWGERKDVDKLRVETNK